MGQVVNSFVFYKKHNFIINTKMLLRKIIIILYFTKKFPPLYKNNIKSQNNLKKLLKN